MDFLPVKHTDFIFAVLGEELGFVGGVILISLYFMLLYYSIRVAFKARDLLGTYMVVGVISMWAFQILVNIGMNVGIMPVTGIPLPFMSYGVVPYNEHDGCWPRNQCGNAATKNTVFSVVSSFMTKCNFNIILNSWVLLNPFFVIKRPCG